MEINIPIHADIQDFLNKMGTVKQEFTKLEESAVKAGQTLKQGMSGQSVSKVNTELKRTEGLIEDIERELKKWEEAKKKATDTTSIEKFNRKIAEGKKDLAEYNNAGLSKVNKEASAGHNIFGKLAGTIAAAFSIHAVASFAEEAFKAYEQVLRSEKRLLNALGGRLDIQKRLSKEANESQFIYGIDDEKIKSVYEYFAIQGQSEEQIKKSTQAAIQLASVMGTDVNSSMLIVGGTFEGTIGRMTRLDSRFAKMTKTQLANGAAVDLINKKYAGVAEASVLPLQVLELKWEELKESIGEGIEGIIEGLGIFETAEEKIIKTNSNVIESNKSAAIYGQFLLDKYISIRDNGTIPLTEKTAQLKEITTNLRAEFGDSVVTIDKQTGAYVLNTKAVLDNINQKLQAADEGFQAIIKSGVAEASILQLNYEKRMALEGLVTEKSKANWAEQNKLYLEYISRQSGKGNIFLDSWEEWVKKQSGLTPIMKENVLTTGKLWDQISDISKTIKTSKEKVDEFRESLIKLGYTEEDIAKAGFKAYDKKIKDEADADAQREQDKKDKAAAMAADELKKAQETAKKLAQEQLKLFQDKQKLDKSEYDLEEHSILAIALFDYNQEIALTAKNRSLKLISVEEEKTLNNIAVKNFKDAKKKSLADLESYYEDVRAERENFAKEELDSIKKNIDRDSKILDLQIASETDAEKKKNLQIRKIRQDALDSLTSDLELNKEIIKKAQAEIDAINKDTADKDKIKLQKEFEDRVEMYAKMAELAIDFAKALQERFVSKQENKLEDQYNKESEALQKKLDKDIITQEQYDKKKKALDEKNAKAKYDLALKEYQLNKKLAIAKIIIEAAVAASKIEGVMAAFISGVATAPLAAVGAAELIALAVATGLQIATVLAAPPPTMGEGGKLSGRYHKDGGTWVNAEKDEWFINRAASKKFDGVLEEINNNNSFGALKELAKLNGISIDHNINNELQSKEKAVQRHNLSLNEIPEIREIRDLIKNQNGQISQGKGYRIERHGNVERKIYEAN